MHPNNYLLQTLLVVMLLAISRCSLIGEDTRTNGYEGFFTYGFEVNGFQPCGSDETWWVVAGDTTASRQLFDRYMEIVGDIQSYQPVYARLSGTPSEKGEYGHLGDYEREFELSDVHDVRDVRSSDCE